MATRALNARLSNEGYEGLELFSRAHGVSKTAMVDAFGKYLATVDQPSPMLRALIAEARETDAIRHSRRNVARPRRKKKGEPQ